MELKQVIYVSEKTDFSNASLTNIYDVSQQKNQEESITGCLLIGSNSYLQVLEGPGIMLPHIVWDTPCIVIDASPTRHVTCIKFVHHFGHHSPPVNTSIVYKQ